MPAQYVDGISITLGLRSSCFWLADDYDYPDYICPCTTHSHPGFPPPGFVGNHYYGDVSDPLSWYIVDTVLKSVCHIWFYRKLPALEADNFEVHKYKKL